LGKGHPGALPSRTPILLFEKDTLLFFYELLNVTPPKARDAAKAIVEEEKRHVQLLSDRRKRFVAGS